MKGEEKLEEIKNKVFRHPNATDLYIKRIPKKIAEAFKKLANDEFVGDYGSTLQWLVNNFVIEDPRITQIHLILDNHEERLTKIEDKKEPEYRIKTMMNGRKIKIPIKKEKEV